MNSFKGITTLSPTVKVLRGCAEAAKRGLNRQLGQDLQLKSQTDWTSLVYLNHTNHHIEIDSFISALNSILNFTVLERYLVCPLPVWIHARKTAAILPSFNGCTLSRSLFSSAVEKEM